MRPEATDSRRSTIALGRAAVVIAAALLLAFMAVRNGAVRALAGGNPDVAAKIWPGHPDAEVTRSMAAIGRSVAQGSQVGPAIFARFDAIAGKSPLAPEPFVVAGIRKDLAGDAKGAERAFQDARLRNPRSLATRYFLAQHYLRANDMRALPEIAALSRLSPGAAQAMTPYLADFAKRPVARRPLNALFRADRVLQTAVLSALASDPANAGLVNELGAVRPGSDAPWIGILISSLIERGEYRKAWAYWARRWMIAQPVGSGLFDPQFRNRSAQPPFNWELTSSRIGLAERQPDGLHLIYYGEDDGVLARQLVILNPGSHRLLAAVSEVETSGSTIEWNVRCANPSTIKNPAIGPLNKVLAFTVASDCGATWIEMVGHSDDAGRRLEIDVRAVTLTRAGQ